MGSTRAAVTGLGLAALLLIAGCTSGGGPTTSSGSVTGTAETAETTVSPSTLTPLALASIGDPLVLPGSDANTHIDYDLLVTNVFPAAITLISVQVRDAATGATLLTLAGDELAALTQGNFSQRPVDPAGQIPPSGQVSVEIDVQLPFGASTPAALDHTIEWRLPADTRGLSILDGQSTGLVTGLALEVSGIEPVRIAAPLGGSGWLSLQGCCVPNGHRSLRYAIDGTHEIKSEMFAADWVRLDNGTYFAGDGSANEDYPYLGADLFAVADGTVVHTRDGLPNETPNQPPANVRTGQDYIGNTVVVQIAPDRFVTYGHVDPGSISVRPGDQVKAGDVVGKLGSSGNSTAAHLHFVVTDGPDFLTATSIPFVVDTWTLQGVATLPSTPGPIAVAGPTGPQADTHPLYLSVADFD